MSVQPGKISRNRADRALELYEKGLKPVVIAERLGTRISNVMHMLQSARQRREKAEGNSRGEEQPCK